MVGRDLTGSGKTLAFALPTIEFLRAYSQLGSGVLQVIVLVPTRELAQQVAAVLDQLKHHPKEYTVLSVYGGVPLEI